MIVIRLQPTGRRNSPAYRIVAAEKSRAVQGKFLAMLGHYLPTRDPAEFKADHDAVKEWISKGARPSSTIARLLAKDGMKNMEQYMDSYTKKRRKKGPTAEEEAAAAAEAEAAKKAEAEAAKQAEAEKAETEAPTEEVKEEERKEEAPAEEEKKEA